MTTWERKVCMLGGAGVGKTSLVRRFVEGMFADQYLSTIGVKVDRKPVAVGDDTVALSLWDVEGESQLRTLRLRYLRGAAGYLLVADGTDPASLEVALDLQEKTADRVDLPFVLALNKADLADRWRVDSDLLAPFEAQGWEVVRTSALTGEGVEDLFHRLALRLVPGA